MIKVNASPAPLLEAALFVVCLVLPAAAQTSVDSCGSTLSSSGSYVVKGTLTASSGNCIEVTAPNVILDLSDGTLVGPGDSGTAVLIHKQAKGAFVFGGVLQGWDVGVEVDSARTVVSDTDISRGANTGVFLNGARKAVVADIDVSDIRQVGVHVRSSSFCTVENVDASTNGEFGFWVESSRNIRLLRDDASESGDTAVFLDHARKTVVSGVDASAAGLGVGVGLSSPSVVGAGVHLLSSSFSTIVDVDASR